MVSSTTPTPNSDKSRLQITLTRAEIATLNSRARRYGYSGAAALARALCRLLIFATDYHSSPADEADTHSSIMEQFAEYADHLAADYGNKPTRHNNKQIY